jgi:hypothetical protein
MASVKVITATSACLLVFAPPAFGAPMHIPFNVPGFGPTDETHQTFTKVMPGLPTLTFEALDRSLQAQGHLHWDADDGTGFGDGFGVRDFPNLYLGNTFPALADTYSQDEIEGNERLRLTFSTPVQLLGFNVTDLFWENESFLNGLPICGPLDPDCYIERGEYSIDGGATWIGFTAMPLHCLRKTSNGGVTVGVDQVTSSLLLRAPGAMDLGGFRYRQLHDFSLAGVTIDEPVPEPATLLLLGGGLVAVAAYGRRKARRHA